MLKYNISFYLSYTSEVYSSAFSLQILSCTSLAPVPIAERMFRLASVTVIVAAENGGPSISPLFLACATVIIQFVGEFAAYSSSSDKVQCACTIFM